MPCEMQDGNGLMVRVTYIAGFASSMCREGGMKLVRNLEWGLPHIYIYIEKPKVNLHW